MGHSGAIPEPVIFRGLCALSPSLMLTLNEVMGDGGRTHTSRFLTASGSQKIHVATVFGEGQDPTGGLVRLSLWDVSRPTTSSLP